MNKKMISRLLLVLVSGLGLMQQAAAQCATTPTLRNSANFSTINSAYSIPCGTTTANLSGITASNLPGGSTLTWHTGTPATAANSIAPTNVGGGTRKIYASFFNSGSNCYSPTREVTIYAPICAADDDYSPTPVSYGVPTTLPSIFPNDTYNSSGFTMPNSNVQFIYELWNTTYVTANPDGTLNVLPTTPVGTYTFIYKIIDTDPDAVFDSNASWGTVTVVVVPNTTLPVKFSNFSVTKHEDGLQVDWATTSETNNDHFDIEVSRDGKSFSKIATVASKATLGNSNTNISYTYTVKGNALQAGLLSLSLLGFLGFAGVKRRSCKLLTLGVIATASMGLYACSKSDIAADNNTSNMFVRIAQVDKNGKTDYSKVVKVVE